MRFSLRFLAVPATAIGILLATVQSAQANSFGPLYADNSGHSFFYDDDLSSGQRSGMGWARTNSLGPTDMTTSVNSGYNSQVDVWAYSTWNPTGDQVDWYAWTTCIKKVSGSSSKCDQFTIVFNNREPHSNYKSLSCHEIGHSVGLGHHSGKNSSFASGNRSCLRGSPDHTAYSSHDKSHINGRY
ncbi:hypothetical protein P1P68_22465 [Streptomyces scabiei]|uniref:hypothetical protein n=1 Tax=Streptomyces scabiei TaxID=1930 RepID=UPI002990116F|nr:hypothetical protein [Streptomyces scabiei]MDW8807474.1 hypothetical protein [Streptomyces scabiei]